MTKVQGRRVKKEVYRKVRAKSVNMDKERIKRGKGEKLGLCIWIIELVLF